MNEIRKVIFDPTDAQAIQRVIADNEKRAKLLRKLAPTVIDKTAGNVRTRILGPMLTALRFYPARQLGMKINWTSTKQRKFVMAKLREQFIEREGRPPKAGESIAYKRTFAYRDGWQVNMTVDRQRGILRIFVDNTAMSRDSKGQMRRYGDFVGGAIGYGKSAASMRRYAKPQQRMHKDRGWNLSAATIQKYTEQAGNEARERYQKTFERIIRRGEI